MSESATARTLGPMHDGDEWPCSRLGCRWGRSVDQPEEACQGTHTRSEASREAVSSVSLALGVGVGVGFGVGAATLRVLQSTSGIHTTTQHTQGGTHVPGVQLSTWQWVAQDPPPATGMFGRGHCGAFRVLEDRSGIALCACVIVPIMGRGGSSVRAAEAPGRPRLGEDIRTVVGRCS